MRNILPQRRIVELVMTVPKRKGKTMPKPAIPFSAFVEAAGPQHTEFIGALHDYLLAAHCKAEIKEAAQGYVVSYVHTPSKKTVANYIFRKKGPMIRMYADHVAAYMERLDTWPAAMKSTLKDAGPCKRLLNPEACNARCMKGFDYVLDGERQQKCRYGGFLLALTDETKPHIRDMMEREMAARN